MSADAVVLRAIPYGEADVIATVYARGLGKLSALARGARSKKRRFGPALELCTVSTMALRSRPQSELWTLAGAEVRESFAALAGDVAAFAHASYAIEITRELCPPEQPDDAIFDLLVDLYRFLAKDGADPVRLRAFELILLGLLGLAPAIAVCAACARPLSPAAATFDPARGGLLCTNCRGLAAASSTVTLSAEAVAFLFHVGNDASLAAVPALAGAAHDEVRGLLVNLMLHHIGHPLKSLDFIAKVNRW